MYITARHIVVGRISGPFLYYSGVVGYLGTVLSSYIRVFIIKRCRLRYVGMQLVQNISMAIIRALVPTGDPWGRDSDVVYLPCASTGVISELPLQDRKV